MNFFRGDCQHPPISVQSFGLCDDQNGTKAYPDTTDSSTWIAEVKNRNRLPIVFTAIDKCIIEDHELPDKGRCDAMLTTSDHLYLIELKDQRAEWIEVAKEQLVSTIELLLKNHDISGYRYKKAFACNRKRGKFAYIDNEENLTLFRRTGFRIDVQAEVVVV